MVLKRKGLFLYVLAAFLVITMLPGAAAAAAPTDIQGHWAAAQIQKWVDNSLVKGYPDGRFQPDNTVTRAEFITMVNRAIGYTAVAKVTFNDVKSTDWHTSEIAKALSAGYVSGYSDSTFRPDNQISRQEAAVIISRIQKLDTASKTKTEGFADAAKIENWSQGAVALVVTKGYMTGYPDKTFRPNSAITRAEAVVVLDRVSVSQELTAPVSKVYDQAGTYGSADQTEVVKGNVIINVPDVTLKNMLIEGDLTLAAGIGEGEVTLIGVTVKGKTTVLGGGANSILLIDSNFAAVIIDKENNTVRIVARGNTTVGNVTLQSGAKLEESDLNGSGFGLVTLAQEIPDGAKIIFAGNFNNVNLNSDNTDIELSAGTIGNLIVGNAAAGTNINLASGTTVTNATMNGTANITGSGNVAQAQVNVNGVNISAVVDKAVMATGISANIAGSNQNNTYLREPAAPGRSGGGGSDNISVTGVSLSSTSLSLTVGGPTATLTAAVAPANATNQTITWSSSNENVATVVNGIVTPQAAGTAVITVTTADGNKTANCTVSVAADESAPDFDPLTGAVLNNDHRTLTLSFNENVLNNLTDNTALKAAIQLSTDGAAYAPLTIGDTIAVNAGRLIITFENPLFTATNKVIISSGSLKDQTGNVRNAVTETGFIDASFEVDNTPEQAVMINTDGTPYRHRIDPATDVDWIKFSAAAGGTYQIWTSNLVPDEEQSNSMDTYIYLYSSDGTTLLAENDDSLDGLWSEIIWTNPGATGTFYLKIVHYDNNNDSEDEPEVTSIGQYDISAALVQRTVPGGLTIIPESTTCSDTLSIQLTYTPGEALTEGTIFIAAPSNGATISIAGAPAQPITDEQRVEGGILLTGIDLSPSENIVITITSGGPIDINGFIELYTWADADGPSTAKVPSLGTGTEYKVFTVNALYSKVTGGDLRVIWDLAQVDEVLSITAGNITLTPVTDYTTGRNGVTILESYLQQQAAGSTNLTFNFGNGLSEVLQINITEAPPRTVTELSVSGPGSLRVLYGTAASELDLPSQVEATLSDSSTIQTAVSWNCQEYDGSVAGDYTFTGTPVGLPSGVSNPSTLTATFTVTVAAAGEVLTHTITANTADDINVDASVEADGTKHLAYERAGKIYVRQQAAGGSWSAEELLGDGSNPCIATASSDTSYVSFLQGNQVMLIRQTADGWTTPDTLFTAGSFDMDVDSSGTLHFAYTADIDAGGYADIGYRSYASGSLSAPVKLFDGHFEDYGGASKFAEYFSQPVIKVDSAGYYHLAVSYHSMNGGMGFTDHAYYIAYKTNSGGGFSAQSPANVVNAEMGLVHNGITVSAGGQAQIVYSNGSVQYTAITGTGTWSPALIGTGSNATITMNSDGSTAIAWVNGADVSYAESGDSGFETKSPIDQNISGVPNVLPDQHIIYSKNDGVDNEIVAATW